MNSAKVVATIIDLSGRIGTEEGIYAYIALPGAKKGPLGKARFITDADELLSIYTTEGTPKPSDNLAIFDALTYLSRANKLYCIRPDNGAGFGGLAIPKESPAVVWEAEKPVMLGAQVKPTDLPAMRMAGTYYNEGDVMRPSATAKFKFICTTAGTTSSTTVDFSGVTVPGQKVEDGSCVWESQDMNHPIGFVYKATTAGNTGETEPEWPTVENATVVDGTVTWVAVAVAVPVPASEKEPDFSVIVASNQNVLDGDVTWRSIPMNHPTNVVFECTTAGTTGETEPTWPTVADETVDDGTAVWKAVAITPANASAAANAVAWSANATVAAGDLYQPAPYPAYREGTTRYSLGDIIRSDENPNFKFVCIQAGYSTTVAGKDPDIDHVFGEDETMFIFGKYQGKDNDNIGIRLYTYQNYPDVVLEPGAFLIEVYYRGNGAVLESFTCSRSLTKKDGYGQNIYVEEVVKASNYINVVDNPAIEAIVDPVDIIETVYMGGGSDGIETITDGMMMAAADKINNRTTFPIKLLLDGNWTTPNYQRKLNAIAADRQDCLALLSTPYSAENSNAYVQELVNYRKETLNLNSYWSAMYTPHIQIYDQYNDRNIWIGASSSAAATISVITTNFAPWYPPAGLNRGILPEVSDVKRRFNEAQMDLLCQNQLNPVAFFSGEGVVLWGNQTLYSRPSALQSLNVMLLIITILPKIAKELKWYLFEFNDSDTRKLIKTVVDTYMNTVKTNKGVYDFQTSVHATADDIDNGLLYVDLIIKPTLAINEIKFRIAPIRTGDSFTTALQILGAE